MVVRTICFISPDWLYPVKKTAVRGSAYRRWYIPSTAAWEKEEARARVSREWVSTKLGMGEQGIDPGVSRELRLLRTARASQPPSISYTRGL